VRHDDGRAAEHIHQVLIFRPVEWLGVEKVAQRNDHLLIGRLLFECGVIEQF